MLKQQLIHFIIRRWRTLVSKELQDKRITQCESCKRFFDDDSMTQIQVRRSESASHFQEMWCSTCLAQIDKIFDIRKFSARMISILFVRKLITDANDPIIAELENALRDAIGGKL